MNTQKAYQRDLEKSLIALKDGGLLLYPTDTIWGLGCDPENEAAIDNLFALKNRPLNKTMLLLAANIEQVRSCVATLPAGLDDFLGQQTRSVTVIYPGAKGAARHLAAADGTIGIRITSDPFCQDLALSMGKPIVSSSANFSGQAFSGKFSDVDAAILSGVDHVVDWRQEAGVDQRPSRIVKPDGSGTWVVLRD